MSLSSDIREYALSLGFDKVGITTADKFPIYEQELTQRRDMYAWAIESSRQLLRAADPKNILPEAKSIVVTVYDYAKQAYPPELVGKIGRFYLSCSAAPVHRISQARNRMVREFLESKGLKVGGKPTAPTGSMAAPARLSGARAGVTNYGKNCFAFAEGIGSFVTIETYPVDVELEYGEPTLEVKCPDKCTLCLDACPTGALYEPLRMNPLLCITYNSYFTPGSYVGEGPAVLPREIRRSMGTWIFGCDVCQEVCPRNRPRLKAALPPNAFLENMVNDLRLDRLLNISEDHFRDRVALLLYNFREKRYLQRNAAVALGNLGDESAVKPLALAMQDPDELVRGHAAWALGRIGNAKSRQILENSLARETSQFAKEEILTALAQ